MLDFYKGKRVFVTGHTGFKGSWLCRMLIMAGAQVTGFSLSPSDENLFDILEIEDEMTSVIGDIRDKESLAAAFAACDPEVVFHLAAQPIVRESYKDPVYTYETNVMGTVNVLECIRNSESVKSAVIITTDKVYENVETDRGYVEEDKLDGYDPYSNSKSCAELAVHSYVKSFLRAKGVAVSTVRAGNVIGGGDFAVDRLVPDCVRACMKEEEIILRNPDSVRPFQHVLEPLGAYLMIGEKQWKDPDLAGWYNIGPEETDAVTAGRLADAFCRFWGKGASWKCIPDGGPHEAKLLMLNCDKIKSVIGWKPVYDIEKAVELTVEWSRAYAEHEDTGEVVDRQIREYLERQDRGRDHFQ